MKRRSCDEKAFKMMAAVLLTVLTAAPFGGFAPSAEAAQTAKPVVKSQTYKHVKQLTYPEVTNTGNASFERKSIRTSNAILKTRTKNM